MQNDTLESTSSSLYPSLSEMDDSGDYSVSVKHLQKQEEDLVPNLYVKDVGVISEEDSAIKV